MFCISKNAVKIRLVFVVMGAVRCGGRRGDYLSTPSKIRYAAALRLRSMNDNRLYIRALQYCLEYSYDGVRGMTRINLEHAVPFINKKNVLHQVI